MNTTNVTPQDQSTPNSEAPATPRGFCRIELRETFRGRRGSRPVAKAKVLKAVNGIVCTHEAGAVWRCLNQEDAMQVRTLISKACRKPFVTVFTPQLEGEPDEFWGRTDATKNAGASGNASGKESSSETMARPEIPDQAGGAEIAKAILDVTTQGYVDADGVVVAVSKLVRAEKPEILRIVGEMEETGVIVSVRIVGQSPGLVPVPRIPLFMLVAAYERRLSLLKVEFGPIADPLASGGRDPSLPDLPQNFVLSHHVAELERQIGALMTMKAVVQKRIPEPSHT